MLMMHGDMYNGETLDSAALMAATTTVVIDNKLLDKDVHAD